MLYAGNLAAFAYNDYITTLKRTSRRDQLSRRAKNLKNRISAIQYKAKDLTWFNGLE